MSCSHGDSELRHLGDYPEMAYKGAGAESAAATLVPILPSHAGPCTTEIDRMQIEVDARIEAIAAAGQAAGESTAATLHHQPTPGSIAAAEEQAGDTPKMEEAVAALEKAREADGANDKSACDRALADVRRAIGP